MRVLVLVDGEHYPAGDPVGIEAAAERGHESSPRCSWSAASRRSTRGASPNSALPTHSAGADVQAQALAAAIDDAEPGGRARPVRRTRARLPGTDGARSGRAGRAGFAYLGPGLPAGPAHLPARPSRSDVAVIGTGKRTGQDSDRRRALARSAEAAGRDPDRGRDGPRGPAGAAGGRGGVGHAGAAARPWSDEGRHAASDYLEDALTAGVTTIGARRAGGGHGRSAVRQQRPRGGGACRERSGARPRRPGGQRRRRSPRSRGTPGSWSSRSRHPRNTWAATWVPSDCCYRTWWSLQWQGARSTGSAPSPP